MSLSFVFSWVFHRSGDSILVVALLHAGINAFDDLWETAVPELASVDWEIPFFALSLVAGVWAAVKLHASPGSEDTDVEQVAIP
jgi:membrane protease YdiL (CAAX protease family)